MKPKNPGFKTYWHLRDQRKVPSEYDVVTSRLLYHSTKGISVHVPVRDWVDRYQKNSAFHCDDWEGFADPLALTYTKYTKQQKDREALVDELLDRIVETGADKHMLPEWRVALERLIPVLRFPLHALQMNASYVGHMAPASRIAMACLFQSADEMRRIQRMAYRMRQIQLTYPGFGEASRHVWQKDPAWQPWRQVLEKLLVTYDWGEAFVALNLVVKPCFDQLFFKYLADLARDNSDYHWAEISASLLKDGTWHEEWSRALVAYAEAKNPKNTAAIEAWKHAARWRWI